MKVGIISINSHTKVLNFASPLHSYAFQKFLDQHGIDNVILDYKPCYYSKTFDIRHPYDYFLTHPLPDEEKQERVLEKWKNLYEEREKRYDLIQAFIDNNYRQTDICFDQKKLDKVDPGCDIYICATDIIWKYNPNTGFDRGFFLACKTMEGKGKIAYSASKGAERYTEEQAEKFGKLISDFDYISVREKSLYNNIRKNHGQPVSMVVDPVFLHEASFYEPLCKEPEEKGYVLLYAVMDDTKGMSRAAIRFAQKRGLKLVELSNKHNREVPEGLEYKMKYGIGIEEWLGYMKYADYIFTNSFHCCCFSIIFQKQFYAGPRPGGKVGWVLEMFGLSNRRINPKKKSFTTEPIDYGPVEALRVQYKERSTQYILEAIQEVSFRLEHPEEAKLRPKKEIEGIENLLPKPAPKKKKKAKGLKKLSLKRIARKLRKMFS